MILELCTRMLDISDGQQQIKVFNRKNYSWLGYIDIETNYLDVNLK